MDLLLLGFEVNPRQAIAIYRETLADFLPPPSQKAPNNMDVGNLAELVAPPFEPYVLLQHRDLILPTRSATRAANLFALQ